MNHCGLRFAALALALTVARPVAAQTPLHEAPIVLPEMRVDAPLGSVLVRLHFRRDLYGESRIYEVVVESVRENTPAARAGIAPKMEVIAIQDSTLSGLTAAQFDALMEKPAKLPFRIVIRRPWHFLSEVLYIDTRPKKSGSGGPAEGAGLRR